MSSAWAGLVDQPQPPVQHFHVLDDASAFFKAGPGRLVAFFSSIDAAEHTVFLTVAKQLAAEADDDSSSSKVLFGRASIGRGTSGATVYMMPRTPPLAPNGTAIPALLTHQFRVPASPRDGSLHEHWRRVSPGSSAHGEPPSPPAMWEQVLEAEAIRLHRFIQAGAIWPVGPVADAASLDALAEHASAIGLLVLPPSTPRALRGYHLRRLARVAARYPVVQCPAARQADLGEWLPERERCRSVLPAHATRFAHANGSAELAALVVSRLGVLPSAVPLDKHQPRFLLLHPEPRSPDGGDQRRRWRALPLAGSPSVESIEEHVSMHAGLASQRSEDGGLGRKDEL
jgi:hypothetical protein